MPVWLLVLTLCAGSSAARPPSPPAFRSLALPPAVTKPLLQRLLQQFVDFAYLKDFRHLGDERDFDHGHILFAPGSRRPVAVLYHTQELAYYEPPASPFAFLDPARRNWLQWIATGRIANASGYVRRSFPKTGAWDWFVAEELPALADHHTIIDKMLDPALVGADTAESAQWVFTRAACDPAALSPSGDEISVLLPGRGQVCLVLSRS